MIQPAGIEGTQAGIVFVALLLSVDCLWSLVLVLCRALSNCHCTDLVLCLQGKLIGQGSFGSVYLGIDLHNGSEVGGSCLQTAQTLVHFHNSLWAGSGLAGFIWRRQQQQQQQVWHQVAGRQSITRSVYHRQWQQQLAPGPLQ
jgi:hypothetical protein